MVLSDLSVRTQFFTDVPNIPFRLAGAVVDLRGLPEDWQKYRHDGDFSEVSHFALSAVADQIGKSDLSFSKHASGKPYATSSNGTNYGVSITHTSELMVCVITRTAEIGLDAEYCDRVVSAALTARIRGASEPVADVIAPIRLWTIKESVLKLLGSGLRSNMCDFSVKRITETLFETRYHNQVIRIASWKRNNHWLSVAFYK